MEKQRKNTRRNRGITLIALVITIIILLILAGVTINSILGNNSLLVKVKQAKEKYNQSVARERLELVLFTMQAEKVSNLEYNENEYLTSKIEENDMKVTGDFVIVDGWEFEINRSVPQIVSEGDKEEDIENNEGLIGKVSKESESE